MSEPTRRPVVVRLQQLLPGFGRPAAIRMAAPVEPAKARVLPFRPVERLAEFELRRRRAQIAARHFLDAGSERARFEVRPGIRLRLPLAWLPFVRVEIGRAR
jgi:hypothetical protein